MSERTDFERELVHRLRDAAPAAAPGALERAKLAIAHVPQRQAWHIRLTSAMSDVHWMQAGVAALVVVAAFAVGLAIGRLSPRVGDSPSVAPSVTASPIPSAAPVVWSGPVRSDIIGLPVLFGEDHPKDDPAPWAQSWFDPRDATTGWVDITRLLLQPEGQIHWWIELTEAPPPIAGLDPTKTIISYGLVLETTGDGVPDYVVGLSTDGSPIRAWVTDLATGRTDEQTGPPYGYPVEFSWPGEPPEMGPMFILTFLGGSRPRGVDSTFSFYAWASVTNGDEVVAWDYAPDAGWLSTAPFGDR